MLWKLGGLALLALGLVVLAVVPISTVTVEVPRANGSLGAVDADGFALAATLISYGFVAAVLALIGWMMWRVVRHHRNLKDRA